MTDPRVPDGAPVWGSVAAPAPTPASPTASPRASGAPTPRYDPDAGGPTIVGIVVVSVVVIAAMLAGVLAWRFVDDGTTDEEATAATPPTTSPDDPGNGGVSPQTPGGTPVPLPTVPPTTAPPVEIDPELAAIIDDLQDFVERQRALDYQSDVAVEVVDPSTFDARLRALLEARREAIEDDGKLWAALGLIDPTVPFFESLWTADITASTVRYDPAANVLLVEDGEVGPARQVELVTQLTAALDDQYFEISRPELDALPDESALAFASLVAGDGARVAGLYQQTMSSDEQVEVIDRQREITSEIASFGIPDKVLVYLQGPPLLGSLLVEDLVFSEGDRLDAAFGAPPTTSEQVIHPSAFEDGEEALEVAPPPADGELFDEGIFGEYLLIVTLTDILGSDRAYDVGEGWGGDWFVAWTTPGDDAPCVRVDLTGDDAGETDEIEAGLLEWAEGSGATVERPDDDLVRFTMCAASGGGAASRL